ncbi:MET [Mytilus coruscus]|uniref:receptor protein-tyrosine kinase n=1 Tax=Mytilus coruscus TaxID=42192 RepID=A0A6J8E3X8_MYTCO|nr:MET [Mytilus coruscus]
MDGIDLLEWDPIFLTQSSYSHLSEEKKSDILSYFDLKPSDNDLEITRHQFRHGQPETAKSLQNKIEESVPKNSVKKYKWGYNAFNSWQAERRLRPISDNLGIPPNCLQKDLVHMDKIELSTSLQYFIAEAKKKKTEGILGVDNPQQLLDTLHYLFGLHFALRGGTEHRRLRLNSNPQITGPFQDKDAKLRYLLYKEDVSKANAGGLKHRKVVPKCVRAFENPENRNKCTVKRLCTSIGLTGKRTNHSLRASAATRLYNAGIEEQRVAETTGHRSNAVRVYKRTSADQQIEASNILYGLRPSDGSKKAKPSAAAGAPQSCIKSIFPMKGPISGKTLLTITGDKFEIGSNLSVKIGKMQCDIQTENDTEIVCLTKSCGTLVQAFEGENLEMSQCRYSGDIVVAIDGASYQPLENKTFCYMPNPEIIQQPSRNSTMISGGLNIDIYGNWFNSVTNHGILISVGDANISLSCTMQHSGSMLVCSTPDLTSKLNKSAEVIVGRMTVILDNHPVKSFTLMIYPDPELDYLDIDTQLKEIKMKDKLLELKGLYLNSSARKEDYIIKINGSRCPVMDLHQTYLICSLSNTIHIKDLPLLVEVSVGLNWKAVLGHIKFFHQEIRQNQIHVQLAAICLGTFAVLILCLIYVMRKKHLGVFRKKATEEFSVVYLSSQETRGLMDPPNDTGNSSAEQGMPRYVKHKKQGVSELVVKGASRNPKPGFDAIRIVDMLKEQNIFIERDLVRLGQDIGHGNFGCVYQGYLRSMEEKDEQLVAIKTVLKTEVQDINAIIDEAMIMKDFNHPNVMSLIGISIAPGEFPLVIIPFMSNGDLLSYIRSADNKPTIKDLVQFGLDVARGMEYLGSIKYVHRDLAARNCMMDENLNIKVADFGLARDIYTKNYYSSDNKKMLPVKWMAPESLENGTYSTKSDVWSFGVVMWELMTRGSIPYCDVNNWDMHKYLQSGRRLKRTDFCPQPLYDIMMACWKFDPYDRPTFREVNKRITVLVEQEK